MKKAIITGVTGLLLATGCASNLPDLTPAQQRRHATNQEASQVLGVPISFIEGEYGYKMMIGRSGRLREIASRRARVSPSGLPNEKNMEEEFRRILDEIDANDDLIISTPEYVNYIRYGD